MRQKIAGALAEIVQIALTAVRSKDSNAHENTFVRPKAVFLAKLVTAHEHCFFPELFPAKADRHAEFGPLIVVIH
jgi:hypothetical protein